MDAQVPVLPARSHAWHVPLHATLQHTPSVQKPERHWLAAVQGVPGAFLWMQAPALQ
jgi:hypothetical protein